MKSAHYLADADLAKSAAEQASAALEQVNKQVAAAGETAEHAQEAAGITSTSELAAGFDAFAANEHKRTLWLRWAAITFVLASVDIVIWVFTTQTSTAPVSAYLIRLSLTVPLLGFSGYFLREATHARQDASEARHYAVRLKLVRAYTDNLSDIDKRRIRAQFGETIFLREQSSDEGASSTAVEDPSKAVETVASLLKFVRQSEQ